MERSDIHMIYDIIREAIDEGLILTLITLCEAKLCNRRM